MPRSLVSIGALLACTLAGALAGALAGCGAEPDGGDDAGASAGPPPATHPAARPGPTPAGPAGPAGGPPIIDPAVQAGDTVGGLRVVSAALKPVPGRADTWVGEVRFGGRVELTGSHRPHPANPEVDAACFFPDSLSALRLPRLRHDERTSWLCFSDEAPGPGQEADPAPGPAAGSAAGSGAGSEAGPPAGSSPDTVLIDEFTYHYAFSDAFNTARRVPDEVPRYSVTQNAPCGFQATSVADARAAFERGHMPTPAELDGSWVAIGFLSDEDSASVNCDGVTRGPVFEWVMEADGYRLEIDNIGTAVQQTTAELTDSGVVMMYLGTGSNYPLDYRCRLGTAGTLVCLFGDEPWMMALELGRKAVPPDLRPSSRRSDD